MRTSLFGIVFCMGILAANSDKDRDTRRIGSQGAERPSQRDAKAALKKAPEKLSASDKAAIRELTKDDPSSTSQLQSNSERIGLVKAYAEFRGIDETEAKDKIKNAKKVKADK